MKTALIVLAASGLLLSAAASAGDIITRQRADPIDNAKVQRYLAEAYRQTVPSNQGGKDIKVNQGCGDMTLGGVQTGPGQQAPREVTTVVKGNVINFCR